MEAWVKFHQLSSTEFEQNRTNLSKTKLISGFGFFLPLISFFYFAIGQVEYKVNLKGETRLAKNTKNKK